MANSPAPTITPERLEEIRALLEKATPGPLEQGWISDGRGPLPMTHPALFAVGMVVVLPVLWLVGRMWGWW